MTHSIKTRLFRNGTSSYILHTLANMSLWPANRVLEKIALIDFNVCKGNIPGDIESIKIDKVRLRAFGYISSHVKLTSRKSMLSFLKIEYEFEFK